MYMYTCTKNGVKKIFHEYCCFSWKADMAKYAISDFNGKQMNDAHVKALGTITEACLYCLVFIFYMPQPNRCPLTLSLPSSPICTDVEVQ